MSPAQRLGRTLSGLAIVAALVAAIYEGEGNWLALGAVFALVFAMT